MIIGILTFVDVTLLAISVQLLIEYRRRKETVRQIDAKRSDDARRLEKDTLLRYQTIFNTALSDMMLYDADGVLTTLNRKACDTFHISADDIAHGDYTIDELLGGEDCEHFEKFYATQIPIDRNGMYYEQQVIPIRGKDNTLTGFFRTGRDVSEEVGFAHQLVESSRDLAKANDRLRRYISNINYVLQVGGVRLATYSAQDHTITLYKESDTILFRLTQLRCVSMLEESSKPKAMRAFNKMDALVDRPIDIHLRTIIRQKDGLPLCLQLQFHPLHDEKGAVVNYLGLCRDESEIVSKEQQLAKESKKAQEVEHVKNVFLRNMSYEIRTPLTSVVGFAELLDQADDPEEEGMFIEQIKQNSNHLLHLINDILFLSRLDADMIDINPQPTDLASMFESFCVNGWLHNKKEGVDYLVENNYERLVVDIDAPHLGNIIEQVTANAARYTDSGSVVARLDYVNNKLVVTVEDTGVGISREAQKHLFERFSSANAGGTGLGLPICQALTTKMGGTISISSRPGHGTTVWIAIPCQTLEIDRKKAV